MDKKKTSQYVAFCFILLLLMVPDLYAGPDIEKWEVLSTGFPIGTTRRHEWHPWVEYNSADKEFMVLWNTSGSMDGTGDISYHSVDAQRISTDGDFLADKIVISPPEGLNEFVTWKSMPKLAYNKHSNEYMVAYMAGYTYNNPFYPSGDPSQWTLYCIIERARINAEGEIKFGPEALTPTTQWNASHTFIAFNSQRKEWMVGYNDKYIFTNNDNWYDNVGFILDEKGNIISDGPVRIDYGQGSHFSPYVIYNPKKDTYMFAWEDFRHAAGAWYNGPWDIYGSLLDGEGNILVDPIAVGDDTDLPDEGTIQIMPCIAYNSDKNEFLVAWGDNSPSLNGGGVVGRIIKADGTPKGPEFVIAEELGFQNAPKMIYVKEAKKYFVVWEDARNSPPPPPDDLFSSEKDIYAKWLNPDGTAAGEDIPIYIGPGNQTMPMLSYSSHKKRFLIAWRDENAPGDYTPVGPGAPMAPEIKADVRGALYGKR